MQKFELNKHNIVIIHEETIWETSVFKEILKKLFLRVAQSMTQEPDFVNMIITLRFSKRCIFLPGEYLLPAITLHCGGSCK